MSDYPVGPRRRSSLEAAEEFDSTRAEALSVPCGFCRAEVSEPCRNLASGKPLEHFPAHACRVKVAEKAARKATA